MTVYLRDQPIGHDVDLVDGPVGPSIFGVGPFDSAIRDIRAWADDRNDENIAVARAYLAGAGPFPERAAVLAVVGGFMTDFADMVGHWADWAITIIDDWPDDPKDADPAWDYFEAIARRRPQEVAGTRP